MSHSANGTTDTPSNPHQLINILGPRTLDLQGSGRFAITEGGTKWTRQDSSSGQYSVAIGTGIFPNTGKWVLRITVDTRGNSNNSIGIVTSDEITASNFPESETYLRGINWSGSGTPKYLQGDGSSTSVSGGSALSASGDTVDLYYDSGTSEIWVAHNGTQLPDTGGTTGDPALGTNPIFDISSLSLQGGPVVFFNMGAFGNTTQAVYSIDPTFSDGDFKAYTFANRTTDADTNQGVDWFKADLDSASDSLDRSVTGVGFQPDMMWSKSTTNTYSWHLFDNLRSPASGDKELSTNSNGAEGSSNSMGVTFDSDGYTFDTDVGSSNQPNISGATYIRYLWKGDGSTGSSNTDGSITSTVNVSSAGHFSFGTFTGTGANATVGHGLPGAPEMIIVKNLTASRNFLVYHAYIGVSDPETDYLYIDGTAAAVDNNTIWNDTAPTSTVFSVGTNTSANDSGDTHVFYAFRSVPGVCRVFGYEGNANSDGEYVPLGFTPSFVMIKNADTGTTEWVGYDTTRDTFNPADSQMWMGNTVIEQTDSGYSVDILADGIKTRTTSSYTNSAVSFLGLAMADIAGGGALAPIYGR
jgi:hypothetical protein